MGGKVKLKALQKGLDHELTLVNKGIIAQKITTELEELMKDNGKNADLSTVLFRDKKRYLKIHKAKRKITKNPSFSLKDAMNATNTIIAVCEGLKQFLANNYALPS